MEILARKRLFYTVARLSRTCIEKIYFNQEVNIKQNFTSFVELCLRNISSRKFCKPSTVSWVCISDSDSPSPPRVYMRLCKRGKSRPLLSFNNMKMKTSENYQIVVKFY